MFAVVDPQDGHDDCLQVAGCDFLRLHLIDVSLVQPLHFFLSLLIHVNRQLAIDLGRNQLPELERE